jgi:hypothetical protein
MLTDVFDRRVGPFDAIPMTTLLRTLGKGIMASRFNLLGEFVRQGRRIAGVKQES